ncbi:hypothetical protein LRE75_15855 [Streptomyces sp. 372A]
MADSTLSLLLRGHARLPDRRRRGGGAPFRTRLLGKRVIALHGAAPVRFFAYRVPEQHLSVPLHRVPTAPRSGFVIECVR